MPRAICTQCENVWEIFTRLGKKIDVAKLFCRKCETRTLVEAVFDYSSGEWRPRNDRDDPRAVDVMELMVDGRRLRLGEAKLLYEVLDLAQRLAGEWIPASHLYKPSTNSGRESYQTLRRLIALGVLAQVGLETRDDCEGTSFRSPTASQLLRPGGGT